MNKTEKLTSEYFDKQGIPLTRIEESEDKTPDFYGQKADALIEVKEINPNPTVENMRVRIGVKVGEEEEITAFQDSTYNAVRTALEDSSRKFRAYDPQHSKIRVVCIYSSEVEVEDIHCVWKGEFSPAIKKKILKNSKILAKRHKDNIDIIALFKSDVTTDVVYFVFHKNDEDVKKVFPKNKFHKAEFNTEVVTKTIKPIDLI